jgi:hypothetical protein
LRQQLPGVGQSDKKKGGTIRTPDRPWNTTAKSKKNTDTRALGYPKTPVKPPPPPPTGWSSHQHCQK